MLQSQWQFFASKTVNIIDPTSYSMIMLSFIFFALVIFTSVHAQNLVLVINCPNARYHSCHLDWPWTLMWRHNVCPWRHRDLHTYVLMFKIKKIIKMFFFTLYTFKRISREMESTDFFVSLWRILFVARILVEA